MCATLLQLAPLDSHASESAYGKELTLDLEQLLTPKNQFNLSMGVTFTSKSTDQRTVARLPVVSGLGQIVDIPITLGEGRVVEDSFIPFIAMRYGATKNVQFTLNSTATYRDVRNTQDGLETSRSAEYNFNSLALGVVYRLKRETATPAFLIFGNTSVYDRPESANSRGAFRTSTLGVTTFKTIDPLVLSARAGYRHTRRNNTFSQGDIFFTDLGMSFAVNRNVTLSGGVGYTVQHRGQIGSQAIDTRRTLVSLDLGIGYAIDQNNTLFINTRSLMVGAEQSSLTLTYSRDL